MKLAVGSVGSAGPQEYRILFEDEYRDDVLLHMRHMEVRLRGSFFFFFGFFHYLPFLSWSRVAQCRLLASPRSGEGGIPNLVATCFFLVLMQRFWFSLSSSPPIFQKLTKSHVDLMDLQPELRWFMRPYLVEFLVEIHQQFRLRPEVLYLTVNIVDRYVSKRIVFKKHYQLVGCAALWIAAKFEVYLFDFSLVKDERRCLPPAISLPSLSSTQDAKDKVPSVEALRDMCCAAYDESAFLQMEGHVLSTISWTLGHPTAEAWLRLSCMGTSKEDAETQHVARFVMELTLFHKEFAAYLPSAIAAGSLLLARFLLRKPLRVSVFGSCMACHRQR